MVLLFVAIILLLAILAIRISSRSGVPSLLLFIVLGMIFSGLGVVMDNFVFADKFVTVALMVIMFQGGFSTKWSMARPVAVPAIVFSSLGVVGTALITGVLCHFILGWDLLTGMLIGSIVGSTDYASVSNILRSKNLNLKYSSAPLLELESGSNDPFAYTMTMIFLSIMLGESTNIPAMIIMQVGLGVALGFLLSFFFYWLIQKLNLASDGLFIIYIVATSIFVYALTAVLKGNGYLAVYIYGIFLGNKSFKGKREVVFFFEGVGDLMQIALFFMLGLLSNWQDFVKSLPIAAAIMMLMFIVSRPLTIYLLAIPFKLENNQKLIISLAGLRGAAAIAFAIMAVNSGVAVNVDIYHIVFGICVLSTAVQGYLMPVMSKKWDMLDPDDTVLKTFNDYQDRAELGFLETEISSDSRWVGKQVKDLNMAFEVIVAKIVRDDKIVVPKGDTIILAGDKVVLGGDTHFDPSGHDLVEFTINANHAFANKTVSSLNMPNNQLIVMVQKPNGEVIVPQGATLIEPGDKLVTLTGDEA